MDKVKPKKKLGQHFLKDERIALRIVESLGMVNEVDKVIEIGPGMGVLTKYLLEKDLSNFEAHDVDDESVEYLKKMYPDSAQQFLLQDFLKAPIDQSMAIIGNFPYNISSQIFFKVYENKDRVYEVVGMIQKEVADRIVSPPGNKVYGILSVLLKAFYDIEYLFTVEPGVFNPPPKVRSAVIRLKRNKIINLGCNEQLFKRIVKEGFQKRRKTLWNALKNLNLPDNLRGNQLLTQRAEQLTVDQFIELTNLIDNHGGDHSL